MDFEPTERQKHWRDRVRHFIESHVRPRTAEYKAAHEKDRWGVNPILEEEKARAKAQGIWNLFMPPQSGRPHVDDSFEFDGPGLTNLEYALCAEEMGRVGWASEVFNCSAPDTGNMEVFHRYGTRDQKDEWLKPLMEGEIRSAFLMTEPAVASSDATNIECRIVRDGDHYVINGTKWWSSGAGDPRCKIAILMGKTDFEAKRHQQQSQILVPLDAEGVHIKRFLPVFGYDDSPHGHMEIVLRDVRVPASNIILGEGRGFEIAQGRLGPGRIHHCMRTIGVAEEALEKMCQRLQTREAFGKPIYQHSVWEERVARARIDIDMTRLLCLKAADMMDKVGNKAAAQEIAMIKVQAPNMALRIIDDAIQAHGAGGVSDDFGLANAYAHQRTLRLADGPDEVHARAIARMEFARHAPNVGNDDSFSSGDVGGQPVKAAVLVAPNQPLEIEELSIAKPGPHEVLIRTAACGLCHSDLHFIDGAYPHALPAVPGHEAAGVVEAVGSEVRTVKTGDHVVSCLSAFCGHCEFCVTGRMALCMGADTRRGQGDAPRITRPDGSMVNQMLNLSAFAEQMLIHEHACVKIDPDMPLDRAAVIGCAVTTGAGTIFNACKLVPGETVAVIGCGGVGLAAINAAKIAGAGMVIACDPIPAKRELAKVLGATHVVDAMADDAAQQVIELTKGGVDHAIEAVGRQASADLACKILRRGGTATILGMMPLDCKVGLGAMDLLSGKKLQGAIMGMNRFPVDLPRLVDFYMRGLLDLDTIISERIPLKDVNQGFEKMKQGDSARSVIVFDQ